MKLSALFKARFNWVILIVYLIISSVSLLTLFSLGQTQTEINLLFKKQFIFFLVGLFLILLFWRLDYRIFRSSKRFLFVVYFLAMFLLALVLVWGISVKGAQSWFRFGFFGFQPIEFAKIALILVLAKYLSWYHVEIRRLPPLIVSAAYAALPIFLVLAQPDFGSALILIILWLGMILISGIGRKQLAAILILGILIFSFSWVYLFKDYQRARILTFLNPERDTQGASYNRHQALVAIGSGGIFGQGLGQGTQARFGFLPEASTDFIFASVGEEWGWIGLSIVMGAFLVLFWELIRVARIASNNFAKLFVGGFMILLLVQVFINSMMNLGLFPVVGIPMPFLSYGGSSFLFFATSLGIVESIYRLSGRI
jgi:rod shape determining protein RodA